MIKKIKFTKMVASGNDFVVIESLPKVGSLKKLAREICDRKFGVGADGLLILSKAGLNTIRMRIFNSDGSEAQMCGNGSRCAALYTGKKNIKIKTLAGIIMAKVDAGNIRVKLSNPKDIKLDIPLKVSGRNLSVNFINTGVPHAVIFVEGLDKIDVAAIGRQIRFHRKFAPAGTNVNFVEICADNSIKVRTYERGVEDETLACGTGSVASALVTGCRFPASGSQTINVHTKGGEILKVYFEREGNRFCNVWLEGKASIVYRGVYNV